MDTGMSTDTTAAAITADITYAVDTGEKPVNETFGPNNIRRRSVGLKEQRPMRIRDGRPLAGELSLDRNGFAFVPHPTAVADFFDADQLKTVYYPEIERLVKAVSGAARVVVFDHTLRSGDEAEREARLVREPVLGAHNDYTEWSGPQRVREFLPGEAEALLAHRLARDQPADPIEPARHRRCAQRRRRRSPRRRAPVPAPGRRDLPGALQPGSPLVLLSGDAARRGARVQGLRLGAGRPRAVHRAHVVRRSHDAAGCAAAAEHRGADVRVLCLGPSPSGRD
jgi:hypothetical protein